MTTLRRGTVTFNMLLGFPEAKPAPLPSRPIQELTIDQARVIGKVTDVDLWLDGTTFTVSFWPRPESPFYNSFDNQRMVGMGTRFFDFKVTADDKRQWTMSGCNVWFPKSNGSMEMQIIAYMLACASDWRSYTLEEFAESWGEDSANDYIKLRWRFCQLCEQFFFRIGFSSEAQLEMHDSLMQMCEQEGVRSY